MYPIFLILSGLSSDYMSLIRMRFLRRFLNFWREKSRSWVFLAPWSRSRLKKPGAGATKKLARSSALREDIKRKEIVLKLLFFR